MQRLRSLSQLHPLLLLHLPLVLPRGLILTPLIEDQLPLYLFGLEGPVYTKFHTMCIKAKVFVSG